MMVKPHGQIGDWKLSNTMSLGDGKKPQKSMVKLTIKIGFANGF
jgi:hypothetical protein